MIYFVQDSGTLHIKIGYSVNAESRVNGLQTGCPSMLSILHTMPGERSLEAALHDRFAAYRVHGEWFKPATAIIEYMLQQKANVPAVVAQSKSPWPLKIYLAGKISQNDWRKKIVSSSLELQGEDCRYGIAGQIPNWPCREKAIFGIHSYVGPYFIECDQSGQSDPDRHSDCYFGEDTHGVGANIIDRNHGIMHGQSELVRMCINAIRSADIVFAWVDSLDCYGTVVEVGFARGIEKKVWICGPKQFRDMWFMYQIGEWSYRFSASDNPRQSLIEIINELRPSTENSHSFGNA